MINEVSAGGLVHRKGKLLLVKVVTLKGEKVWTFPKGHLDDGETSLEAALREVTEETGYACRSLGPLMTARYFFTRSQGRVSKSVKWYLMEPERKVGAPDAAEILAARWVSIERAAAMLSYPSDLKLLEAFRNYVVAPPTENSPPIGGRIADALPTGEGVGSVGGGANPLRRSSKKEKKR